MAADACEAGVGPVGVYDGFVGEVEDVLECLEDDIGDHLGELDGVGDAVWVGGFEE